MAIKNPSEEMFAGNRRRFRFPVLDEDEQPLDMTGYSAIWSLCEYEAGGKPKTPPVLRIPNDGGSIDITPAMGIVMVDVAEGLTANLEGVYHAELEIFDAQANSCVVATGDLHIRRNV